MWSIQCFELLMEVPNSVNGSLIETPNRYSWLSNESGAYAIDATLSSGVFEFSIGMQSLEFEDRSRFRGRALFKAAIDHLGVKNIDYIKGRWVQGNNYNEFVNNLFTMNEKKAAKATWTGRRAAEHGFTRVKRVIYSPAVEGVRKGSVKVYFARPYYDLSAQFRFLKRAYNMEYWDE